MGARVICTASLKSFFKLVSTDVAHSLVTEADKQPRLSTDSQLVADWADVSPKHLWPLVQ